MVAKSQPFILLQYGAHHFARATPHRLQTIGFICISPVSYYNIGLLTGIKRLRDAIFIA